MQTEGTLHPPLSLQSPWRCWRESHKEVGKWYTLCQIQETGELKITPAASELIMILSENCFFFFLVISKIELHCCFHTSGSYHLIPTRTTSGGCVVLKPSYTVFHRCDDSLCSWFHDSTSCTTMAISSCETPGFITLINGNLLSVGASGRKVVPRGLYLGAEG